MRAIDEALSDWPRVTAAHRQRAITGGRSEALELIGTRCRAYNEPGESITLLTFDQKKHWWRAEKILAMSHADGCLVYSSQSITTTSQAS